MNIGKKRNILIVLLFALAIAVVGGVLASYNSIASVQNRLNTKDSSVTLNEIFNPSDQWVPGETKQKEVSFGNVGESDQVVRFKVSEIWYDNKGTSDDLTDDSEWTYSGSYDPLPAVINYTSEITGTNASWVRIGDYYYYNKILAPGESTPIVIESVTFSNLISNSGPGAVDDFSDKRYSLTVQLETMNVNTTETIAGWNMTFTSNGDTLTWSTVS